MAVYRSKFANRKPNPFYGFLQLVLIVFVLMGIAFMIIPSH